MYKILFNNLKFLIKHNNILNIFNQELNYSIEQALYEELDSNVIRPNIYDSQVTIEKILKDKLSIARFGDGEITIINGHDIPFQVYDCGLAQNLLKILSTPSQNFLQCINFDYYYGNNVQNFLPYSKKFYRKWIPQLRKNLTEKLNFEINYGAAGFTQIYQFYKNYNFEKHYDTIRQICENKKIVLAMPQNILKNLTYNIFDNAEETILYTSIPNKNAYDKYDRILNDLKNYSTEYIILIIAGPTAKVLAYDLHQSGYQALDIGHLLKDYNSYKLNEKRTNKNINKFFKPD